MIDVIYLNGGVGVRAGLGYPKQFARLKGKPIIIYGLEVLNKIKEIGTILIPTAPAVIPETIKLLQEYNIRGWKICDGGSNRQESVNVALDLVESDNVLITESVRPFINIEFVNNIINFHNNVIPRSNTKSTLIGDSWEIFERENIGEVQMPQKYDTETLRDTYKKALSKNDEIGVYSDDADLFFNNCNEMISIIPGLEENIKITTKLDLYIAEAIYDYINR